ncbi:SDR family NAD(P)-dependent oxidoreductase [Paraburkholderia strydomiana]
MKHSIALVTGTTSGVGYEAARLLAANGYRQVIVTGRSLARVQETVAQLAAQTRTQVFTPLELELDEPTSVQSALAELVKRDQPIDFLLLNAGLVPGKKRMITTAGVEASQAPLIGHHQLTVGLLRANLLSPNARIAIASAEPARGGAPMFKYTDVDALAARYHQGDRTAAMEALLRNGPSVKYVPNNAYADAKLIVAWWVAALARRLPPAWPCTQSRPVRRPPPMWGETPAGQ